MTDPQNPQNPQNPPYEAPAYEAPAYPSAAPAYAAGPAPAGAPVPGKALGIVAFILSFFLQLIGLILGIVALVQSKKAGHKNGWAVAAIILSSVLMVIGIIVGIALLAWFANLGNEILVNCGAGGQGYVELWGQQIPCSQIQ